ncbi:hypothetical protein [Microbulbifer sp. S227A]|uniref:hypothetical protein n=1 Tax=Microbulbifer sp. S227A TaxID=3415131 RepID=UPI003C7C6535
MSDCAPDNRFDRILESDMCIGCGLCQSLLGKVAKKRAMLARYKGLGRAGCVFPETRGLRLQALYDANPASENRHQEDGAFRRATSGRATR